MQDIKTLAQLDEQPVNEGISIVSCSMNRNENLRKALITWLQLDVDEIVIVDWSSKEPVEETIKDLMDHRVKIIRVEGESEWVLTYAFNVGLRFTRYSKVYKFDADIQVSSDFLEKNKFLQGEFCRGSWKLACDSGNDEQKFVNGSFCAFKKDLLEIGYYNEFIRTYGYDDSDLYKRLTDNAGLAQKFIEPSSILHLDQKEELRLINQNIAKQQFLDCYNATELYNLINKNVSQLYDFWFPNKLQSYSIEKKKNNVWLADRVSQHEYIPAYIQTDAISYAVIKVLTWKFNYWVWLPCDIKSLAIQLYADHKRQIPFNCSQMLLGLDKSLSVFFIGENDFLSSIASIDRDCDIAECCLVTSTGESYEKIKNFSKSYTVVGYDKDDYEKLKQLRSDITCEKNDSYEPAVDENNGRLLATSVYDEKVPHRMQEYLECFGRNISEFDILVLYYEEQNGAFLEGAKELYEKLKHSRHSLTQVFFISIDYRPTFRSIFDSIDLYFPGVTAFVSNADIAFDDTIKLVQSTDLDDVFLVLSRKECVPKSHTDDGLIMNQFGISNTFSADVWIYKAPLKYDFKADFPIGSFHCDSYMNFYIGKSDYRLYNPCLSVNCFHIHDPLFNSSEEKSIVLHETIQKKLDEEIIACGGEKPLRGLQWCRITDIKHPNRADMTLMWSDMIINFNLKSDGSNILAVLIQVIIALKINSKVLAGHAVNINMPHDMCHSDIAEIIFHFRQFINSSLLTIGVSNKGKDEVFVKELPHYQKVEITPETLITSYQSAILERPGSIYDSNTKYYVKDGVFGVGYTPALLCQSGTEEINDIEIYCLLKCLNTEDKQLLQNYFTTSIDAGFMQFYPFFQKIIKDYQNYISVMYSAISRRKSELKEFFNFIYMEKQSFIFVYNPKVACTNWKCILRYINGHKEDYLNSSIAHNQELSGLCFISELSNPSDILSSSGVKKYSFVRSPYTRVLSAYLNKIEPYIEETRSANDDNSYFYRVYCNVENYRIKNFPAEKQVNFFCFLHWIQNVEDTYTLNEHWLSQTALLRLDKVSYDFIGRFETLEQDAKMLLTKIECDVEFPSQSKIQFAPTNANEKIKKYYSEREVELVNNIYAHDFDALGYEIVKAF
tara:strand:- start:167 stop:3526 length:3360 start_codon:yes stop_codon:yes gene_type:complete